MASRDILLQFWPLLSHVLLIVGAVLSAIGLRRLSKGEANGYAAAGCLLMELAGILAMPGCIRNVTCATREGWLAHHALCMHQLRFTYLVPMVASIMVILLLWRMPRRLSWPALIGALCLSAEYATFWKVLRG
jgi:hypothetical protein